MDVKQSSNPVDRAVADIREAALDDARSRYAVEAFTSVEAMCEQGDLDVVWIATPNMFHMEHTIIAAEHHKHVIVVVKGDQRLLPPRGPRFWRGIGGGGRKDGEFVAANARDDIRRTECLTEHGRDFHQRAIAGPVTERIVDDLQLIDIEEDLLLQ